MPPVGMPAPGGMPAPVGMPMPPPSMFQHGMPGMLPMTAMGPDGQPRNGGPQRRISQADIGGAMSAGGDPSSVGPPGHQQQHQGMGMPPGMPQGMPPPGMAPPGTFPPCPAGVDPAWYAQHMAAAVGAYHLLTVVHVFTPHRSCFILFTTTHYH
jgi:small nuclear ribonucleoprotein B and B'